MRPARQCKSADHACMPQMGWSNIPSPLAICNEPKKWRKKLITLHSKWADTNCINSRTNDVPKNLHLHTFGCTSEWALSREENRPMETKVLSGIYLGPSLSHESSVHLIMSPVTGHVSPQFHVTFDDFFETIKQGGQHIQYLWHLEAGQSSQQKSVSFYDEVSGRMNTSTKL